LEKNEEEEKKMKRLIAAVVLVGIVLTSTASATLGTANIQGHNNGLSDIGTVWGGGLSGVTGRTGVYSWTNAGGTGLGTLVPDWGFCIELIRGPYTGWHNVIPLNEAPNSKPMGAKADLIRELWGRHFNPTWTAPGGNTQMAEAFGTAIWEIIYETDPTWDVTSGPGFYATGIEQYATANAWLNELDGTGPRANLAAISTLDGQDYVVQVPEPATITLLGLGALSLLRRKR
jgi:hypothetical protein